MLLASFCLRQQKPLTLLGLAMVLSASAPCACAQESASPSEPPVSSTPAPIVRAEPQQPQPEPQAPAQLPAPPPYDKSIFQPTIPAADLAFLGQFSGAPSGELFKDKQFKKVIKGALPNCEFHYGRDMPLWDALEMVFDNSHEPVQVRDGRYVLLNGRSGPYLNGRAFLWVDMQDGIVLGGFFFTPTNGEPTPALNIFSRQVREQTLGLSQLPPAFVQDMTQWAGSYRVPFVTTQYFLTGTNRKILLEHDEDYCNPAFDTRSSGGNCEELNANAADDDETAAAYVDATRHTTNATAWMIGEDQMAWIAMRDRTCGGIADPLPCRIRLSRERTRVIIARGSPGPRPVRR